MNKYVDYIPIEKSNPKRMAYGKAFPDDEIRSTMGRAIPPEWSVNLLSMGKEPWTFKYLDDHLSTYRQKWQADPKKKNMLNMTGKSPGRSSEVKRKNNEQNAHNNNGGRGHNNDQNDHFKNITC
jgi:hypothetical protein